MHARARFSSHIILTVTSRRRLAALTYLSWHSRVRTSLFTTPASLPSSTRESPTSDPSSSSKQAPSTLITPRSNTLRCPPACLLHFQSLRCFSSQPITCFKSKLQGFKPIARSVLKASLLPDLPESILSWLSPLQGLLSTDSTSRLNDASSHGLSQTNEPKSVCLLALQSVKELWSCPRPLRRRRTLMRFMSSPSDS